MSRFGVVRRKAPFSGITSPDTTDRNPFTSEFDPTLYNATGVTVTCFFTPLAASGGSGTRVVHAFDGGAGLGFVLWYNVSFGGWVMSAGRGGASVHVALVRAFNVGQRYFFAGWMTNTSQGVQIDHLVNDTVQGVSLTAGPSAQGAALLAHSSSTGLGAAGIIEDPRIYKRSLSPTDRNNIRFGNGFDNVREGLVLWLRGNDHKAGDTLAQSRPWDSAMPSRTWTLVGAGTPLTWQPPSP